MIRSSLRESLRQLREAAGASIVAVLLVTMASTLAGVLGTARSWVTTQLLDESRPSVLIAATRTPADATTLAAELASSFNGLQAKVLPPSAVRDDLATWFPDIEAVVRSLDEASFPPLVQIDVSPAQEASVREWLAGRSEVALLTSSRSWQDRLRTALRGMVAGGFALAVSLLLGCSAVVVLVVRLLVLTHADEIAIMRLIGARERDIKLPYLLSGALLGLVGSLVGIALTAGVVAIAAARVPTLHTSPRMLALLPAAGTVVGLLGAAVGLAALPREP